MCNTANGRGDVRIGRSTPAALLSIGLIAALGVGSAAAAIEVPSHARTQTATTVAAGSQHDALTAAAHGSYTGRYGTLRFRDDGTATFDILNCGFTDRGPGRVKIDTSCRGDGPSGFEHATGPVTVGDHSYEVRDPSRTNVFGDAIPAAAFDAYVDDGGMLHVFYGDVGYLGSTRRGTVHYPASNIDLEVGKGSCMDRDTLHGTTVTARCKFVQRDGRTLLLYRGKDPFPPGKVTTLGLVYLPKTGLLVQAPLVHYVFKKTSA